MAQTISASRPTTRSLSRSAAPSLKMGGRVTVGGAKVGRLRFVGHVKFATGEWCGVELDEPEGRHDGTVDGVAYFKTAPKHAVFAPPSKLQSLQSPRSTDSSVPSALRAPSVAQPSGRGPKRSVTTSSLPKCSGVPDGDCHDDGAKRKRKPRVLASPARTSPAKDSAPAHRHVTPTVGASGELDDVPAVALSLNETPENPAAALCVTSGGSSSYNRSTPPQPPTSASARVDAHTALTLAYDLGNSSSDGDARIDSRPQSAEMFLPESMHSGELTKSAAAAAAAAAEHSTKLVPEAPCDATLVAERDDGEILSQSTVAFLAGLQPPVADFLETLESIGSTPSNDSCNGTFIVSSPMNRTFSVDVSDESMDCDDPADADRRRIDVTASATTIVDGRTKTNPSGEAGVRSVGRAASTVSESDATMTMSSDTGIGSEMTSSAKDLVVSVTSDLAESIHSVDAEVPAASAPRDRVVDGVNTFVFGDDDEAESTILEEDDEEDDDDSAGKSATTDQSGCSLGGASIAAAEDPVVERPLLRRNATRSAVRPATTVVRKSSNATAAVGDSTNLARRTSVGSATKERPVATRAKLGAKPSSTSSTPSSSSSSSSSSRPVAGGVSGTGGTKSKQKTAAGKSTPVVAGGPTKARVVAMTPSSAGASRKPVITGSGSLMAKRPSALATARRFSTPDERNVATARKAAGRLTPRSTATTPKSPGSVGGREDSSLRSSPRGSQASLSSRASVQSAVALRPSQSSLKTSSRVVLTSAAAAAAAAVPPKRTSSAADVSAALVGRRGSLTAAAVRRTSVSGTPVSPSGRRPSSSTGSALHSAATTPKQPEATRMAPTTTSGRDKAGPKTSGRVARKVAPAACSDRRPEVDRLSALCESRTKQLSRALLQLKEHGRTAEALALVVLHLTIRYDAFGCPLVKRQLATAQTLIRGLREANLVQQAELQLARAELREKCELHERSELQHEKELSRQQKMYQTTIAERQKELDAQLVELQELSDRRVESMRADHEDQERELQTQHDAALGEMQQTFEARHLEISSRFDGIKISLLEKVDLLRRECEELRQREATYMSKCHLEADEKIKLAVKKYETLPQEVESMKLVIEMKNEEIHALRTKNNQLINKSDELPDAHDRICCLVQKLENMEAILQMKDEFEKELREKHCILMRRYDKETKANRQLSMSIDELSWRLQNDSVLDMSASTSPATFRRTISHSPTEPVCSSTPNSQRRRTQSSSIMSQSAPPNRLFRTPVTSPQEPECSFEMTEVSNSVSDPDSDNRDAPVASLMKRSDTYDLLSPTDDNDAITNTDHKDLTDRNEKEKCKSVEIVNGDECKSLEIGDGDEPKCVEVLDGGEPTSVEIDDGNECKSEEINDGNECTSVEINDGDECTSVEIVDGDECTSVEIVDGDECTSVEKTTK